MPPPPPKIHTYHCAYCSTLLLCSTHQLSHLPTRHAHDQSIILPLDSSLPSSSSSSNTSTPPPQETNPAPPPSYTTILNLTPSLKPLIIRREDGFEKRNIWRCGRCDVIVGYRILVEEAPQTGKGVGGGSEMETDGKGEEAEDEVEILYLLRGALMSTAVMGSGKKILEGDADVLGAVVAVYE